MRYLLRVVETPRPSFGRVFLQTLFLKHLTNQMTTHYLLSCSISAEVRQSVQIKFDDLKLPTRVIETLVANNTVSIRPNLSNALKGELDSLRVMQRDLYDSYCIHYGDAHFVTSNYFVVANDLINQIKQTANDANERLKGLWESEYHKWQETAEGILRPLFSDDEEYKIAFSAYMRFFPTKEEYRTPIRVSVLGPLPVSLQKVSKPIEGDIESIVAYENQINTSQVLEAAQNSAADRALMMGAELVDDLDTRHITKIGKQQTGSDKKRGSWQITAEKLKLISDSVPGFTNLSTLAENLLNAGSDIQSPDRNLREKATENFYKIQEDIRAELESICNQRDSSKGLEKLKQSIALSTQYKTLCERIKNAENANALNLLIKDANVELDVYEQRSKQLKKLIAQRKELIGTANENLDSLISEVTEVQDASLDF